MRPWRIVHIAHLGVRWNQPGCSQEAVCAGVCTDRHGATAKYSPSLHRSTQLHLVHQVRLHLHANQPSPSNTDREIKQNFQGL